MELIRGLHNLRPRHRGCVATVGAFDGVHRGHQTLLRELTQQGAGLGAGFPDEDYARAGARTAPDAEAVFREAGLRPLDVYTTFGDQFLCIEASTEPDPTPPDAEAAAEVVSLAEAFREHYDAKVGEWSQRLAEAAEALIAAGVDAMKRTLECCRVVGAETLCGPYHSAIGEFTGQGPTADEWKWGVESMRKHAEIADVLARWTDGAGIRAALADEIVAAGAADMVAMTLPLFFVRNGADFKALSEASVPVAVRKLEIGRWKRLLLALQLKVPPDPPAPDAERAMCTESHFSSDFAVSASVRAGISAAVSRPDTSGVHCSSRTARR